MYATAGRRISIIGHSQGGMLPRWVLRFWPDTRAMVDDDIGFAASNHGTTGAEILCQIPCAAADWQQSDKSQFIAALNSYQETFPGISYTEVYSHIDEIVTPNSDDTGSSSVHGGGGEITNVAIQDVCPADPSEHLAIGTQDYVAYDLAIDALEHPGPADPARAQANDPSICTPPPLKLMPGINPVTYPTDLAASAADLATNTATAPDGARRAAAPLLRHRDCAHRPALCAGTPVQGQGEVQAEARAIAPRRASAATARSAIRRRQRARHAAERRSRLPFACT